MVKLNDYELTPSQYSDVRREAEHLLRKADALGVYPTPVAEIMDAGKVVVAPENVLDEGFLRTIRHTAGSALKRAMSKVIGIFDARERLVFINQDLLVVKQTFLKLHETGHAVLPWQRDLYAVIEDSKHELKSDTAELFEREANVFATEVLFQLDDFISEAADHQFGIQTPLNLSKKYGASVYASVRQYVNKNSRDCIVLILNPPEPVEVDGFRVSLRRAVRSPSFREKFGEFDWPEYFTPNDKVGALVPLGNRRMSGPQGFSLVDRNGTHHDCLAEAFRNNYQIFILIHTVHRLSNFTVSLPSA